MERSILRLMATLQKIKCPLHQDITLRTIKTFGNYIGVILKQYTCTSVPFNGYRENSKPTN